jgi:hypothetical protein
MEMKPSGVVRLEKYRPWLNRVRVPRQKNIGIRIVKALLHRYCQVACHLCWRERG